MYVPKTPAVVKALYSSLVWNMPRESNAVYLTFDDGPHPQITLQALTQLEQHKAKASFFCIGRNVEENPGVFERIKSEGHSIGNHTYDHLNGWKTQPMTYYRNVLKCQPLTQSQLFRPPYGKITREQARVIAKKFRIIMWDVLSGDFDKTISKEKCLENVLKNIQPGSIIVFHDSEKAAENMLYALPRVLEYAHEKKWFCQGLNYT